MNKFIIDIGNSNTKIYSLDNKSFMSFENCDLVGIEKYFKEIGDCEVYISYVNSKPLNYIKSLLSSSKCSMRIFDKHQMMEFIKKNEQYKIDNIDILGADLFADIISGSGFIDEIIIDLGTATKILVINRKNEFLGATIFPGLKTCLKALNSSAEKIELHDLKIPDRLISLKTDECVNSGAIYGTAIMIEEYVKLIIKERELNNVRIVLTGGFSSLIDSAYNKLAVSKWYEIDSLRTIKGIKRGFGL